MSAQGSSSSVWVWCPVSKDASLPFHHPSDVPNDNEALAKSRFLERERGPRLARIGQATLLQTKGNLALIAERGATREVPKQMVLNWYEGLLLLEELESTQVSWCDDELRAVLDTERRKLRNGQLSGALYTERRLATTAVTGGRFIDGDDREWSYCRENLRSDEKISLTEGEDAGGWFRIRDIVGYLPPWEAFCHEKCGFYQDFYQVRWEYPFSEVDYSKVENGCTTMTGATWEPDECLPAHLDPLRLGAKRAWIKRRREQEQKAADERGRAQALKRQRPDSEAAGDDHRSVVRKELGDERENKAPKLARSRRDGAPLARDLFRSALGHDFEPGDVEQTLGGIRTGWPRHAQDYPKGFGVANPPGFCWEGCDCMDDQRPQRSWETNKAWLEDPLRSAAAQTSIETFTSNAHFVRRRGQVSRMCYFETFGNARGDQKQARSALELAGVIEKAVSVVLKQIPACALSDRDTPVRIPAAAFLSEAMDYEPLRFTASSPTAGVELPRWVKCHADDGRLFAAEQPPAVTPSIPLRVELLHAEGAVGAASCGISPERSSGLAAATAPIIQRFGDKKACQLDATVRTVLTEHLGEVYDFAQHSVRERSVGEWLDVMSVLIRMLRSSGVTNISRVAAPSTLARS